MPNLRIYFLPLLMTFQAAAQVFVSPTGRDSNSGTAQQPVGTLARAVEISRALPTGHPKRIVVARGDYFDTGVTLTAPDSSLVIEAESAGRARLIGGVLLSGWEKEGTRFWSAALPAGRTWDVRMLEVNGRFCPRARYPEQGTLAHTSEFKVPWMSTTGGGWKRKPTLEELTTLQYKRGDIPKDLDLNSAEITVFHMWDESVARISQHDSSHRILKLSPPLGHPPGAFGVQKYCLWNIREGMTDPGQWYFDRNRSRIVYWPLAGEQLSNIAAVVPTQRIIVRISGATNVTLRKLVFAVTTVPLITGGFAAAAFDGAIQMDKAYGASLSQLHIENVAGQAIKGMHQQSRLDISDCTISGCGAGGIYLSGANNIVSNNLIHGVGWMFPSAIGLYGGGEHSRLSHNEIFDTTYSAIGFGGKDMVIENNEISHCMKVLHDGGAIYCFGIKDSILRNNFAHDIVDTGGYGASAYYLDEQSENTIVESNISINVARPSHNHMATNNVIRGNVFLSQQDMRLTFPRCAGYRLESNILYSAGAVVFEGANNVSSWSRNLVFSRTGKVERIMLKDYSSISTEIGVPGDTVVGDPQFRDLSKTDLGYSPESPAARLGLSALDNKVAGRVRDYKREP